ncbi:MAG: DUF1553 domain-containing protein, partial [Planctomycetes bacterium]|nr:DUF1553 domain-containing protein [Planctomycetota bacterium]
LRESGKCNDCQVYLKGEKPTGSPIPRGFVSVVSLSDPPKIPSSDSGRLQFAQWLTNGEHPLTARVMVNRVWHHLFGSGIVRTVDNFGINGERPSHPELLDYLATRFVNDQQWSVKKAIRAIMLSRTYQLSAEHDSRAIEVDPENRLHWRHERRRMDGESIRDSILAASAQLDRKPPASSIVAKVGDRILRDNFTVDEFRVPTNHRSVYLPIIRNGIPEVLSVFDFADASLVVGRRNVTTVPAQELYLMNSLFVVEQAKSFAKSLLEAGGTDDSQRVDFAYRRALSRPATEGEISRVLEFVVDESSDEATRLKSWSTFCQALYTCAEFRYVK